jgi:hypothetical protein
MKPFRAFLGSNEPLMHAVKQNWFMDKYRAIQKTKKLIGPSDFNFVPVILHLRY